MKPEHEKEITEILEVYLGDREETDLCFDNQLPIIMDDTSGEKFIVIPSGVYEKITIKNGHIVIDLGYSANGGVWP